MKRLLILFMVMMVLSGCGKNKIEKTSGDSPESTTMQTAEGIRGTNNAMTHSTQSVIIPTTDITEESLRVLKEMVLSDVTPHELLKYIEDNMEKADANEAEGMLLVLESVQLAWLDYYKNAKVNLNDTVWIENLNKNGFIISHHYESLVPVPDYNFYRQWVNKLSDWFVQYIELAGTEIEEPAVLHGRLNIPIDELESRLLQVSQYVEDYPQSVRMNEMLQLYELYLYSYLYGYDSSPVFDFQTNQIYDEYFHQFEGFAAANPDSGAVEIISGFIDVLERNNHLLSEEGMAFIENVFTTLKFKRIVVRNDIGKQFLIERIGKLMPERTGFTWTCRGSAEYGHTATLESMHTEDSRPVYNIIGAVEDFSEGDVSPELLNIFLQYRIDENILSQSKSAPMMMDSDFDDLEIIRYPFVVGHCWNQNAIDQYNNRCNIETEIIGVTSDKGVSVYEVEYRNLSTGGYEKRLIHEGKATTAFIKLDMASGEFLDVGYSIVDDTSGYSR